MKLADEEKDDVLGRDDSSRKPAFDWRLTAFTVLHQGGRLQ